MGSVITLDAVLQGIFLGLIIAVLAVAYNKLVIGRFVKALINAEAVHPSFAKSFEQLKIRKNFFFAYALRKNGSLRKLVLEPEDKDKKGSYYIPEDKLYRAGRLYGGKDVDFLMVAATIIILFLFFIVAIIFAPAIVDMAKNIGG